MENLSRNFKAYKAVLKGNTLLVRTNIHQLHGRLSQICERDLSLRYVAHQQPRGPTIHPAFQCGVIFKLREGRFFLIYAYRFIQRNIHKDEQTTIFLILFHHTYYFACNQKQYALGTKLQPYQRDKITIDIPNPPPKYIPQTADKSLSVQLDN